MSTPEAEASETTVHGLDNIPLELPIAGAGSRALSAFLDYLVVGVVTILWGAACVGLATYARLGWWALALFLIGYFLIEYGYFAGMEIAREGQTLGKWALGLRVVTRAGARPGTAALLVRNAVRSPDLVVGIPMMATDALARRLGDRLADTLVVHTHARAREAVAHRMPQGWDARDAALLETFLRRAHDMESWRADALAGRLLDCIQEDDPGLAARADRSLPPVEALRRLVESGEA